MSRAFLPFATERVAIVSLTRHGLRRALAIQTALPGAQLFAPEKFASEVSGGACGAGENGTPKVTFFTGKVGEQMPTLFADFDGIVAVVSLGAMVRLVAPHLKDKNTDPGIVVVDEAGKFAIPMLAGHLGGANALAAKVAAALGATPVYTTASDARQTLAVDLLGREFGWRIEASKEVLLRAAAAVVNDAPVALVQEAGRTDWWASHANGRNGPLPDNLQRFARLEAVEQMAFEAVLWISERAVPEAWAGALAGRLVTYRPGPDELLARTDAMLQRYALGVGCDRGTPTATLRGLIDDTLQDLGATPGQVVGVGSIDLKADEAGLLDAVAGYGWPLRFYPAADLAQVPVPNPSETVRRHTGTPSVSEAAALLVASAQGGATGQLVREKVCRQGADGRNATLSVAALAVCDTTTILQGRVASAAQVY